eukprot:TRINITY_DN11457_c0_g2_i1.p1 TRINITY_DN11457_c0_g2~~TRINITY_DN11457_c0_g2_i1.p1  ORF type:complete len:687 (+),score=143.70 TRINITY_DN11457_c0_g2_i1:198-2063(+)
MCFEAFLRRRWAALAAQEVPAAEKEQIPCPACSTSLQRRDVHTLTRQEIDHLCEKAWRRRRPGSLGPAPAGRGAVASETSAAVCPAGPATTGVRQVELVAAAAAAAGGADRGAGPERQETEGPAGAGEEVAIIESLGGGASGADGAAAAVACGDKASSRLAPPSPLHPTAALAATASAAPGQSPSPPPAPSLGDAASARASKQPIAASPAPSPVAGLQQLSAASPLPPSSAPAMNLSVQQMQQLQQLQQQQGSGAAADASARAASQEPNASRPRWPSTVALSASPAAGGGGASAGASSSSPVPADAAARAKSQTRTPLRPFLELSPAAGSGAAQSTPNVGGVRQMRLTGTSASPASLGHLGAVGVGPAGAAQQQNASRPLSAANGSLTLPMGGGCATSSRDSAGRPSFESRMSPFAAAASSPLAPSTSRGMPASPALGGCAGGSLALGVGGAPQLPMPPGGRAGPAGMPAARAAGLTPASLLGSSRRAAGSVQLPPGGKLADARSGGMHGGSLALPPAAQTAQLGPPGGGGAAAAAAAAMAAAVRQRSVAERTSHADPSAAGPPGYPARCGARPAGPAPGSPMALGGSAPVVPTQLLTSSHKTNAIAQKQPPQPQLWRATR